VTELHKDSCVRAPQCFSTRRWRPAPRQWAHLGPPLRRRCLLQHVLPPPLGREVTWQPRVDLNPTQPTPRTTPTVRLPPARLLLLPPAYLRRPTYYPPPPLGREVTWQLRMHWNRPTDLNRPRTIGGSPTTEGIERIADHRTSLMTSGVGGGQRTTDHRRIANRGLPSHVLPPPQDISRMSPGSGWTETPLNWSLIIGGLPTTDFGGGGVKRPLTIGGRFAVRHILPQCRFHITIIMFSDGEDNFLGGDSFPKKTVTPKKDISLRNQKFES